MKKITVELTIDQWQNFLSPLEDLAEVIHLVNTEPDLNDSDFDWYSLQPQTRQFLNSGSLWDVCQIIKEINEQSRSQ